MTKTKTRKRKPPPYRVAVEPVDGFLIGLATSATGETQAELVARMFRDPLRKLLLARGLNPDKAWEQFQATNRS